MKKNMFKVAFVAAIAMVCGINVLHSQKCETLSEVTLANVEALADKTSESAGLGCKLSLLKICETSNGDHPLYRNLKPGE